LTQLIQVGTSAGGARAKAVVCFNPATGQVRSGQLGTPEGYEHWLLKLDGVEGSNLGPVLGFGRVEFAYSLMAAEAGVTMEPCRLLVENERAHFMTRRFDRLEDGTKLHTQTLCALDHLDFNVADTHSYAQYFDVIDRLGLGPDSREQAFRRVVFNVAAVNRDDHTKNLSFCCDQTGQWELSPAYDVNHAYNPHGQWTQRHQMSVNGKFDGISRGDLLDLADRYLVPAPAHVLGDVIDAVSHWPSFAEKAEVPPVELLRIAADHTAFHPA
jgi:serine/threonine-protein kinase HipA